MRSSAGDRLALVRAVLAAVLAATLTATVTATVTASSDAAVPARRSAARATWGNVVDLAASPNLSRPHVVVDRAGGTTVGWRTQNAVVAIRQDAAGVWGDPHRLGNGTGPQVAVDRAGTVTAIWTRRLAGSGPQVMTARRPLGGRWSAPVPVSDPVASRGSSGPGAFQSDLAVSHDGAVLVSWLWGADDSGTARVQARLRPAGGSWRGIATLSPVEARTPVCAIGDHGRAVVVYTRFAHVFAARRSTTGWRGADEIGAHAQPPQVAMDDAGDATVVWASLEPDGVFRPQAVTRRAGAAWRPPRTLDPALDQPAFAPEPVVAQGPRGHAAVAWVRPSGQVVMADHPLAGPWSGPTQVAPPGVPAELVPPYVGITIGRGGSTLLSWTRTGPAASSVEAAYRPVHRAWQQPARLSPAGADAAAADAFVPASNRAVAAWRGRVGDLLHLQLRRLRP